MRDLDTGIYLDNAATTALDASVLAAMMPYLTSVSGNPSSLHRAGRMARRGVEESRERVAGVLGVRPRQVTFTSGATEADNLAIKGVLASRAGVLVSSTTEHAAVLNTCTALRAQGRDVVLLEPDATGEIPLPALEEALSRAAKSGGAALVALMHVNNETGVLTDVRAAAAIAHGAGALYFSDAVQAAGLEDVSFAATDVDVMALSGHKVNGPKGVGVLVKRDEVELLPQLTGGSQEQGLRPGTHAVSAIVGMGAALELAEACRQVERARLAVLQAELEAICLALDGVALNGAGARRGVKHSSFSVEGVDGEALLMALDDAGVYVSAGSACAAGSLEPSHVLLAMGLSQQQAKASVRFSLGRDTTLDAVREAGRRFAAVVERCRVVAA
ncbi:MAG TPA: cysteine desulfurase family protein [Trueperaceae bacterium]|nr:cysteine desulfurase family protein [Trueperaceae bacterium]